MTQRQLQLQSAYQGKTVLVTGHTGFKGAWLSEWLLMLGARVVGVALRPNTQPALFDQLELSERVEHHILDIRNRDPFVHRILSTEPDYVFHMAAQPLVRLSYREPVDTYATNVMGTIHLLDALRHLNDQYRVSKRSCAAVFVATDKCYENVEWLHGYRENDPLGGYDPYSSSKAAAELAIAAYRSSFLNPERTRHPVHVGVASARAGNVIGGGDWALDRIVPDCIRSLQRDEPISVRNPTATRPWQHVLEPLSGYLELARRQYEGILKQDVTEMVKYCSAYNFGPYLTSNKSVQSLVEGILGYWPGRWRDESDAKEPHEAGLLNLAWDKAFHELQWRPQWDFTQTLERTVAWYRQRLIDGKGSLKLTQDDIEAYGNSDA
jgi:CDP-glucose 4,6-dehydratase